jgi:serine protease Do
LNIDGEMIGINVAVRAGAQGIGFAIPVDRAIKVATDLLTSRNVRLARHGLVLNAQADPDAKGLVVASVEKDGPAAAAGVQPGDVLVGVDEIQMDRPLDFQRAVLDRKPGDRIKLALRRGTEPVKLDLTLAAAGVGAGAVADDVEQDAWTVLGLRLQNIPAEQFRAKYKTRYRGGLGVAAVRSDSPAADQGIRSGDVLVGMHVWETVSMDNVAYILRRPNLGGDGPVKFYILRGDETLYGYLSLGMKVKTAQR